MKKMVILGCAVAFVAGALYAKAAKDDDCPYCGVGAVVVDVVEPDPIITPIEECAYCGGGSYDSGTWNSGTAWSRAATKKVYIVNGDGIYAGTATISTAKKSKNGKVSVKVVFNPAGGKSVTAKQTAFMPDDDETITATWVNVKNIGSVELTITPEGEVNGTAGIYEFSDSYETSSGDDDGDDGDVFVHGAHTFSVDIDDYTLNEKYELLDETIPSGLEIVTNSKKWNCGKTASIKYKKVDGEYELVGLDDESKTNVSGLKITFNAKNNTFKGSFKVYATNEGSIEKGKPKLKSYKFTVTGRISGGMGVGTATCKSLKATWSITVD